VVILVSVSDPGPPSSLPLMRLELEARVGIEPTHRGFADLGLTTWLPRLIYLLTGHYETSYH
jgi:hypothetical protein